MAIVVAGLALSAPPGFSVAADHDGLLLHPIFPHGHGSDHRYAADDPLWDLASHEPASTDVAPGLTVPLATASARDATAGIVLPFVLAVVLLNLSRRRLPSDVRPTGESVPPLTPPPRYSPSVI